MPARRIASSALCAALLVGIAGPVAMAADSARGQSPAASREARHPGAEALLAHIRKLEGGELAPVADLLHAALGADRGRLPAAEARRLGAAAKDALAKAAARTSPAPGTGVVLLPAPAGRGVLRTSDVTDDLNDTVDELLDAVSEAVDGLLGLITPRTSRWRWPNPTRRTRMRRPM
ncbi:hypothetical protein KEF29_26590 [Streptomyces tuirus]|uniref:Uncharacterized protein n=1 Tax=Streptomyces tuirus TaxID=68278 RepID=A0A941FCR5_9ACTN|nr:hypothetical protein [Streptomyces tuirus]